MRGRHARAVTEAPDAAGPGLARDGAYAPRRVSGRRVGSALAGSARPVTRRAREAPARAVGRLRRASPRTKVTLAAAAGLTASLTVSLAAFLAPVRTRPGTPPRAAVVNILAGRRPPVPAAVAPRRPSRSARHGDEAALAFYRTRDSARAAHVEEVVWTGPMLRVYTDLPASDADSKIAIALCETAASYAQAQNRVPSVFVHADRQAGFPVLANKMDSHDDCRLGRVP